LLTCTGNTTPAGTFQEFVQTVFNLIFSGSRISQSLFFHPRALIIAFTGWLFFGVSTTHAEVELPPLGDTSAVTISPLQERILGQKWLRAARSTRFARLPYVLGPFVTPLAEQSKRMRLRGLALRVTRR
jgi:hypothetical protein